MLTRARFLLAVCSLLFCTACSRPSILSFRSNPVQDTAYSSNKILLQLDDFFVTYTIEWLYVDHEWFCKIITGSALRETPSITLAVNTEKETLTFTLSARRGGDIYRMEQKDTASLIACILDAQTVQFTIGNSTRSIRSEEFQRLYIKGQKKAFLLPI